MEERKYIILDGSDGPAMTVEDQETFDVIIHLEFAHKVIFRLLSIYFGWRAQGYSEHDAYFKGVIGWLQQATEEGAR